MAFTNREIDQLDYSTAIKVLRENKVTNQHELIKQGPTAVKSAARHILRQQKKSSMPVKTLPKPNKSF